MTSLPLTWPVFQFLNSILAILIGALGNLLALLAGNILQFPNSLAGAQDARDSKSHRMRRSSLKEPSHLFSIRVYPPGRVSVYQLSLFRSKL